MREKLVSVTAAGCEWEYFRCGGNGGQKQNKTSSGARVRHLPSGAIGESREERSQRQNRQKAWEKMSKTKEMQIWLRIESARKMGQIVDIESSIDNEMKSQNLKVEIKKDGKWIEQ